MDTVGYHEDGSLGDLNKEANCLKQLSGLDSSQIFHVVRMFSPPTSTEFDSKSSVHIVA